MSKITEPITGCHRECGGTEILDTEETKMGRYTVYKRREPEHDLQFDDITRATLTKNQPINLLSKEHHNAIALSG